MKENVKRVYQFVIILGLAGLFLMLAVSIPVFHNSSDFSIYNGGWNGCSGIGVKTYKTGSFQPSFYVNQKNLSVGQRSFADYDLKPGVSSILVVGPRTDFSDREIGFLRNFVNDGGRLLIADDFGTGNQILEGLDCSCRFTNDLMLDFAFKKKPCFVNVFDFKNSSHPLVMNVSSVLLNYPTSIRVDGNCSVLARSTDMSWLDSDNNGLRGDDEKSGGFPVLTLEHMGNGSIVVFSAPSLFINSMKKKEDNPVLVDNLMNFFYQDRSSVMIDESHRTGGVMSWSYIFPSSVSLGLKIGIVLLAIVLFIFSFTRIPQEGFSK